MTNFRNSYPASAPESAHWTERVVTEGHAAACREHGHATWTVDGVDQGMCPRCGVVTTPANVEAPAEQTAAAEVEAPVAAEEEPAGIALDAPFLVTDLRGGKPRTWTTDTVPGFLTREQAFELGLESRVVIDGVLIVDRLLIRAMVDANNVGRDEGVRRSPSGTGFVLTRKGVENLRGLGYRVTPETVAGRGFVLDSEARELVEGVRPWSDPLGREAGDVLIGNGVRLEVAVGESDRATRGREYEVLEVRKGRHVGPVMFEAEYLVRPFSVRPQEVAHIEPAWFPAEAFDRN